VPVGTLWRWASEDAWQTAGTRGRRLVSRTDALRSYERRRGGLIIHLRRDGMTKTAQLALSRGMVQQIAGTGVTVNRVLPAAGNSFD
jgi:NAD(P)-dependent dehydrogenase (short-subunit alcohol dehydrogenase family)